MATAKPKKLAIRSEEAAFVYLQQALEGELENENTVVTFDRWPMISIKLEGEGYDSTITPDLAEALVQLQHAMNRAYARAIHETTNARTLTNKERDKIKFKAKVRPGSSIIEVNLGEFATKVASDLVGKMDPIHLVVTVISLAVVGGGALAYKSFLKHRSEDKKVEQETQVRVALSQEESRRLEILAKAMAARPQLAHAQQDFDDVRRDILRSASDATSITMQGTKLSNDEARTIAATPRSSSDEVRLDGHYTIQKIDWSQEDARLWVASTDSGSHFVAALKNATMTKEQRETLKSAEWDRKPLHMTINGTKLRGEVTTASIVEVSWPANSGNHAAGA